MILLGLEIEVLPIDDWIVPQRRWILSHLSSLQSCLWYTLYSRRQRKDERGSKFDVCLSVCFMQVSLCLSVCLQVSNVIEFCLTSISHVFLTAVHWSSDSYFTDVTHSFTGYWEEMYLMNSPQRCYKVFFTALAFFSISLLFLQTKFCLQFK